MNDDESVVIRPVTDADRDAVVGLLLEWAPELGWADLPGPAREAPAGTGVHWRVLDHQGWAEPDWDVLVDVPAWSFLVALAPGTGHDVVGFARGKPTEAREKLLMAIPEGGPLFEVTELYVTPTWRRRGVGSRLLTTLLESASAAGIERSTLVSATTRSDEIIRFYRRHGFEPWWVEFFRGVQPRG